MKILGIETSCDDTGIAVIEAVPVRPVGQNRRGGIKIPEFKILSNIVSSQVELHKKYGGVYPTLAKREHQRNLVLVLEQALKGANLLKNKNQVISRSRDYLADLNSILEREPELLKKLKIFLKKYQKPKIDLIAVTQGPGLEPCLWVGINFAKALAFAWDLPIVPVNHIEAHILANFVGENPKSKCQMSNPAKGEALHGRQIQNPNVKNLFPAISLIVSGGHTQLILMKDFGKYKIIGETKDDAAGECFDKTARILGLGYPGGPAISAAAEKLQTTNYPASTRRRGETGKLITKLPRPMIHQKNYDFSFSGLKTAVLYEHKKQPQKIQKSKKYISEMAKEIQQAIIDVLIKKTIKAAKDFKVKSIILGGGVTANKELRKQLQKACLNWKFKHLVPLKNLCTDNGVMAGVTGYFHKPRKIESIEAEANLRI